MALKDILIGMKRCLERIDRGGRKDEGIDNVACSEKLWENLNCFCDKQGNVCFKALVICIDKD